MKGTIKIGSVAGIELSIHWTFSLLVAYLIFMNYSTQQSTVQLFWTLLFIITIFGTVLLHELGHAFAAKKFGYSTLNITLLPIGGIANLESIPEKPKEELIVALAGPFVNLVLAFIVLCFITVPGPEEIVKQLAPGVNANNFFIEFFIVNIWLAGFNLIPAFPMDGGRVLRAILSFWLLRPKATTIAARVGQVIAIGFVILGFYGNIFLIVIGVFIYFAAQAEASFTYTTSMLAGATVQDALMKHFQAIDANESINTAVRLLLQGQAKNFVVLNNSIPIGTLSQDEIIRALSLKQDEHSIFTILNREPNVLQADLPLEIAFQTMQTTKNTFMPVYKGNQFEGVIDSENILEYLLIKQARAKSNSPLNSKLPVYATQT